MYHNKVFRNILVLIMVLTVLAVTVTVTLAQSGEGKASTSENPLVSGSAIEKHTLVAKNDRLALYLLEERLSIIVEDVQTGAIFRSTTEGDEVSNMTDAWKTFIQSGVVVEYIKGTNLVPERVDMVQGEPEVEYGYTKEGFIAKVFYEELSIGYSLNVTLTETGINVTLPESSIIESSDDYKVGNIYVFPFLGYSEPGMHEGYMFIPDGVGALIYLEDNEQRYKQPYSEKIYGTNIGIDDPYVVSLFDQRLDPINKSETILAPVYGMAHTDDEMAMLAQIQKGQASATIQAFPNGAITKYDWITSFFVYRQVYNQLTSQTTGTIPVRQKERNHFDIEVDYKFLFGEEANYVGMAKMYRDSMLESGAIEKKTIDYSLKLDFFGADEENWLFLKRIVAMTTSEQLLEILEELHSEGVESITATYLGWQDNGYYGGLPLDDYDPEKKLGGKKGMAELVEKAQDMDYKLFFDVDPVTLNVDRVPFAERKSVKKLNKQLYNERMYKLVYRDFFYSLPEETKEAADDIAESFTKNEMENLSLRTITNTVYSYLDGGEINDRQDTLQAYTEIIDSLDKDFNLILEQPYDVYLKYVDAIAKMPVESSKYIFVDEEVPFFPIVFNGVIPMYSEYSNFMANQENYRLQMIEQGIWPSFLLTYEDPSLLINTNSSQIYSSNYDHYKSMLIEYDAIFSELAKAIDGAMVENYEKMEMVSVTTYTNGVKVFVNYGDESAEIDGISIKPKSAKVGN